MSPTILYKDKTSLMQDKEKNSKNLSYFLLSEHTRKMSHLNILLVSFALLVTPERYIPFVLSNLHSLHLNSIYILIILFYFILFLDAVAVFTKPSFL